MAEGGGLEAEGGVFQEAVLDAFKTARLDVGVGLVHKNIVVDLLEGVGV